MSGVRPASTVRCFTREGCREGEEEEGGGRGGRMKLHTSSKGKSQNKQAAAHVFYTVYRSCFTPLVRHVRYVAIRPRSTHLWLHAGPRATVHLALRRFISIARSRLHGFFALRAGTSNLDLSAVYV